MRDVKLSKSFRTVAVLGSLLATSVFAQQSAAVLTGTVTDAATGKPVPDVVVTATSPSLQGEAIVVTDEAGSYRIPQLAPGTYSVRLEKESFKPYSRGDISLRVDRTIRLNIQLQPEALKSEEIVVVGRAPTVDVSGTTTGVNVGQDFIRNIALVRPGAGGTGTRSFESLSDVAPQVNGDTYGFGSNGTTSPENSFVIDGLQVNDPAYGVIGTPLSLEFIGDVNVVTGGYLPEYGRAIGSVLNAVTKSGSNEFHGSVFGNWAPGVMSARPKAIPSAASVFETQRNPWNTGDFGAELGGPIIKDRLWFYAGFNPSFFREQRVRNINGFLLDADGNQIGTQRLNSSSRFADSRSYQYIGKLTFLVNSDNKLTLSVYGSPTASGGGGSLGINPQSGAVDSVANGTYSALAARYISNSNDVSLKYQGGFLDKRLLVDVTLGWHHQDTGTQPSDGSTLGSTTGDAATPLIQFRRTGGPGVHNWLDYAAFDPDINDAAREFCDPNGPNAATQKCPAAVYYIGGHGFIDQSSLDRYQGRAMVTLLLNGLGHHVIKGGIDVEWLSYSHLKGYTGGVWLRDNGSGSNFRDLRQYGYLTGPETFVVTPTQKAATNSLTWGGFLQDSWSIVDKVTLNAGLRYDTQTIFGTGGQVGLSLNTQLSPRVGLVYDFTQQGRSKVFANYARYYQSLPLDISDRSFPGERTGGYARARTANANRKGCDPIKGISQALNECQDPNNYVQLGGATDPSRFAFQTGGDTVPVDPNLRAPSDDEFLLGGEYEVIPDGRAGITYTHRYVNSALEDMSRDEASTYFIGNPGFGVATDFPKATRDYDAVTAYFTKAFSDQWLAQVSYTWSYTRGNYAGLFRPETDQLDPGINSTFDLISLLTNTTGPLPGDRTHAIKVYAAKEFTLAGWASLTLGLNYRGRSGTPINYLGSHPVYGGDEAFVLPRGAGGRTPWVHTIDARLGVNFKITKDNVVTVSADLFNLFNFLAITQVDESFTQADVRPVNATSLCVSKAGVDCAIDPLTGGKPSAGALPLLASDGTPITDGDLNANFKRPTQYQSPLSVRLGVRLSF